MKILWNWVFAIRIEKNFKVIKFFYKGKTIFNMHECDPHSNEFNDHGRLKSIEATMKDKAMVSF